MSFFDKLKGGMGVEEAQESKKEKKKGKKIKAEEVKSKSASKPEPEPEIKKESKKASTPKEESQTEGQLAIDVYETNGDFVIESTIAGVKAEDLDISVENDLVTVRGSREKSSQGEGQNYFYQECYWGSFSRQVILPEEVDGSRAQAKLKDGVLILKIPKVHKIKKRKITVKQEE